MTDEIARTKTDDHFSQINRNIPCENDEAEGNLQVDEFVVDNWGHFLSRKMANIYQRSETCDLELCFAEGQTLWVHLFIMNLYTDFFRIEQKKQKVNWRGQMLLPDSVSKSSMEDIVQFMYTGKLRLTSSNYQLILKTSKLLAIDFLTKEIVNQIEKAKLKQNITETNSSSHGPTPIPHHDKCKATPTFGIKESDNSSQCRIPTPSLESNTNKTENATNNESSTSAVYNLNAPTETRIKSKAPFKSKVRQMKNVNPRTIPSSKFTTPVKRLTTTDVFYKYRKQAAATTTPSTSSPVHDFIKKNPHILKGNKPVKLVLLDRSPQGHEKLVSVTVKPTFDSNGVRKIQVIHTPEDNPDEEISAEPPWSCKSCRKNGKTLEFDSYFACRQHHSTVHNRRFDPKSCQYCGITASKKLSLCYHQLIKHNIQPPKEFTFPICDYCSHVSQTEEAHVKHVRKHGQEGGEKTEPVILDVDNTNSEGKENSLRKQEEENIEKINLRRKESDTNMSSGDEEDDFDTMLPTSSANNQPSSALLSMPILEPSPDAVKSLPNFEQLTAGLPSGFLGCQQDQELVPFSIGVPVYDNTVSSSDQEMVDQNTFLVIAPNNGTFLPQQQSIQCVQDQMQIYFSQDPPPMNVVPGEMVNMVPNNGQSVVYTPSAFQYSMQFGNEQNL